MRTRDALSVNPGSILNPPAVTEYIFQFPACSFELVEARNLDWGSVDMNGTWTGFPAQYIDKVSLEVISLLIEWPSTSSDEYKHGVTIP